MKRIDRILKNLSELYEFNRRIQRFRMTSGRAEPEQRREAAPLKDIPKPPSAS
ncbi:MAG TPA: hypothetical protein PLB62_00250 [Candidatus Sumerlaeota bacterium]|nr:hypothetical protein [Candidatus Sumerlaeota bacterium]